MRTVYVAYRMVNTLLDRVVDVISSGMAIHVALDGYLSNSTALVTCVFNLDLKSRQRGLIQSHRSQPICMERRPAVWKEF